MTSIREKIKNLFFRLQDLTAVGAANFVSNIISIGLWFYIAALLGTSGYGQVSYFIAIGSFAYVVSLMGTTYEVIVYTAKEEKTQSSIYLLAIVLASIASIIMYFIFENIGISVFVIGSVFFGLVTAELLGRKSYKDYAKYMISQRVLQFGLAVGFYYLMGIDGIVLGFGLSFFPFIFKVYKSIRSSKIDFGLIKSRFGFMMGGYGVNLSRRLSMIIDKLIIFPLFGYALLGNYHLGFQVLLIMSILPQTVFDYLLPQDATGKSNKKLKKMVILISGILAFLGFVISPLIIPILYPDFNEAIIIIQIMSLAVIPMTISIMYISKFFGLERSKLALMGSIIHLTVQISLIIILGNLYGINGAAIALVLAYTAQASYLVIVDQKI